MTRAAGLVAALVIVCVASVRAATSEQVLRNGDFEGHYARGVAVEWADNSGWADLDVRYSEDREQAHRGAAQKIECLKFRTGAVQFVQGGHAVANGRRYEIRVWMKGDVQSPVEIQLRQHGAPYRTYASQAFKVGPKWTEYRFVAAPAVDDGDVLFMFIFTSTGTLWIDDASMRDVTAQATAKPALVGNRIANGSFEVGIDRWGARIRESGGYQYEMTVEMQDPRLRTTAKTAKEGRRALEISIPAHGQVFLTSPYVQLNAGRKHTLSMWLSADRERRVRIGVASGELDRMNGEFTTVTVGREWRRAVLEVTPAPAEGDAYYVSLESADEGRIWMDGVNLEEDTVNDYTPAHPAEVGFEREDTRTIYDQGENVKVPLSLHASADGGDFDLVVTSVDFYGHEKELLRQHLGLAPQATQRVPVAVPTDRTGYFRLVATVAHDDTGIDRSEMAIGVVHPHGPLRADSPFGAHVRFSPRNLDNARRLGVSWLRMHPPLGTKWATIEPEKGRYVFQDEPIMLARRMGFHILGSLDTSPKWASSAPDSDADSFRSYPPKDLKEWEDYVFRVVSRYKGTIDHWEVWNEPDSGGFLKLAGPLGSFRKPAVYAELLEAAYRAAKRANPQAEIVGGCATGKPPTTWTKSIFKEGAYDHLDALSFHFYTDGRPGDALDTPARVQVDAMKALMHEYGHDTEKPIWESESGVDFNATAYGNIRQVLSGYAAAPSEVAAYVVRNYVHLLSSGVTRWFYYHMFVPGQINRNEDAGMFEWDGSPRPAALAYANLAWLLGAARYDGEIKADGDVVGTQFADSQRTVQIYWRRGWGEDGSKPLTVAPAPAGQARHIYDLMGNDLPTAAGDGRVTIDVGRAPVYVVYAGVSPAPHRRNAQNRPP